MSCYSAGDGTNVHLLSTRGFWVTLNNILIDQLRSRTGIRASETTALYVLSTKPSKKHTPHAPPGLPLCRRSKNIANIVWSGATRYQGAAPARAGGGGFRPAGRPATQPPSRPPSQPPSQPPLLCTCMLASPPLLSRSQDDVTDPWSVR